MLKFDQVNEKMGIPLASLILSMMIQVLLGLIYLGSSAAFNAFNGSGVIFLTLSYVIPVAVSFFTGRKQIASGKFNLGAVGIFANIVSIGKSSEFMCQGNDTDRSLQPGAPSPSRCSRCLPRLR